MSERAMEVWNAAKVAYHSTTSPFPTGAAEAAATIIAHALADERKTRDAEICAWLRGIGSIKSCMAIADAIERGDV